MENSARFPHPFGKTFGFSTFPQTYFFNGKNNPNIHLQFRQFPAVIFQLQTSEYIFYFQLFLDF
jgi:hypothetical protein